MKFVSEVFQLKVVVVATALDYICIKAILQLVPVVFPKILTIFEIQYGGLHTSRIVINNMVTENGSTCNNCLIPDLAESLAPTAQICRPT